MIPVIGFVPDQDPTLPGALVECDEVIPSDVGMKGAPTPVDVGLPALADECRGAAIARNLSGNKRLLAGTETALYDASATSWNDVSAATYALGADDRWSFCQFGDATIAATISQPIQRSVSGAFAAITNAPKAEMVESVKGFVIAFHTNETNFGDSPDRWWCSALYDETDWTPSVSTQCTTGRLVEGGGPITAARRLGDDIVVYKGRAMFLGRYAGAPEVWSFTQVASEVGCVGQEAIVDIGVAHVFVGEDDIYIYDGVRPQSIASGQVRQWFVDNRDPTYAYRTRVLWDRQNSLVWIFYPSASGDGAVDAGLVYHTKKARWGVVARDVEAAVNYISPSITYDSGTPLVTTYDASPSIPYDSPFWVAGTETPAIFQTDHAIYTLSGTTGQSSFTVGDFGDEDEFTMCDSFKVRYKRRPESATCTGYTKNDGGQQTLTTVSTASRDDASFDMRQTGRWHRFKVTSQGAHEFMAIRANTKVVGTR
jgi:hypothetical protein